MEDWRLCGQERFLTNAVLYRVTFPDFWQKAYEEKNPFYQKIADYAEEFVATHNHGHQYLEGDKVQAFWHEHCEFCWEKATTDTPGTFYCTKDLKYWICETCFKDFYAQFGWSVRPVEELFYPAADDNDILTVYNRLKDRYDLMITTTAEIDRFFSMDCPIIVGKAHGHKIELFKDGSLFILDIEDEAQTRGTHFHPNSVDSAAQYIEEFMEGKLDYELFSY